MTTSFTVHVEEKDWNATIGGWYCSALGIPGATVARIYSDGSIVDSARYQVDQSNRLVRWPTSPRPHVVAVEISLEKGLTTSQQSIWITAAVSIATALISAGGTYLAARTKVPAEAFATPPSPAAQKREDFKPLYGPTPIEPDATYQARVAWVNLKSCAAALCDIRVRLRAWETATGKVLIDSSAVVPSWSEGKPESLSEQERKMGIKPVSMRHPELEHGEIVFLGKNQITVQMGCDDRQGKAIFGASRDLDARDLHAIFPIHASCDWAELEMGFGIDRAQSKRAAPNFGSATNVQKK